MFEVVKVVKVDGSIEKMFDFKKTDAEMGNRSRI